MLPLAIGRCFLKGWSLSDFLSAISLIKYMDEVSKESRMKPRVVCKNSSGLKRFPLNTSAAYIAKFLSHCLGRAVLTIE